MVLVLVIEDRKCRLWFTFSSSGYCPLSFWQAPAGAMAHTIQCRRSSGNYCPVCSSLLPQCYSPATFLLKYWLLPGYALHITSASFSRKQIVFLVIQWHQLIRIFLHKKQYNQRYSKAYQYKIKRQLQIFVTQFFEGFAFNGFVNR